MESSSMEAMLPEPLLRQPPSTPHPSARRQNRLAVLLGRATGRSGAPTLVRERAALQLEERRADWGYSSPVVAIDILWNLGFAIAAVAVLWGSSMERPNVPVRIWVVGYAVQCVVHVVLVWVEFRRRRRRRRELAGLAFSDDEGSALEEEVVVEEEEEGDRMERSNCRSDFAKRCESLNTMASFIWWFIGFYWVVCGGETLAQDSPKLYWLSVVFLAFDVFFAIFFLALACVIGIALCCCLPCIIAILYALAGQEGATDADISILPRYRYEEAIGNDQKIQGGGIMILLGNNNGDTSIMERAILREDAECCICLTSYEDGTELHALPCDHHFHSACIIKWLRINATCPLCKYNILKGNEQV